MKLRAPSVALRQGLLWVGLARLGSPPKDRALSLSAQIEVSVTVCNNHSDGARGQHLGVLIYISLTAATVEHFPNIGHF